MHQELSEKQKPPTHQGGGLQSSGGDLFSEFPHHTSSETFVPDQGHLSSPLPGCQTRLRVVPDVGSDRIGIASKCNKILCHSKRFPCPPGQRLQVHAEARAGLVVEAWQIATDRIGDPIGNAVVGYQWTAESVRAVDRLSFNAGLLQ